jgi:hypothetical protein
MRKAERDKKRKARAQFAARMEHARVCTGVVSCSIYMTTAEGQTVRVLDGTPCDCARGKRIARTGCLQEVVACAARRRGPTWVTRAELEAKHFHAAGLPMWGIGVLNVGP